MRFVAESCLCSCTPVFDVLTFSVDLRDGGTFNKFLEVVERESGSKVEDAHTTKYGFCRYLRKFGISFIPPSYFRRGWSLVYFTPTQDSLKFWQSCIMKFFRSFEGDEKAISKRISLKSAELAFDFIIPSLNNYSVYEGIIRRLFYRTWLVNGRNTFCYWMSNGLQDTWDCPEKHKNVLFSSFDEALLAYGRKRDSAVNGDLSCYICQCRRDSRHKSSHYLSVNNRSNTKLKFYPKLLEDKWVMRVEVTLLGNRRKELLPLEIGNFSGLLDKLKVLQLREFVEFREADFSGYVKAVMSLQGSWRLKDYIWQRRIDEVAYLPVSDQIRFMRCMADVLGPKANKLKASILRDYTKKLSFQETVDRKLPADLRASRRMPQGVQLDNLKFREPTRILVHIGKRRYKLQANSYTP